MLKLVSTSADDKTLVRQVKSGNELAFRLLVERHSGKVRNLICLLTGKRTDADDLAQEVFIKVYRGIGGFREESGFATWLYRITVNTCNDEMRKRKIRSIFRPMAEAKGTEAYGDTSGRFETQEVIRQGISRLPSPLRLTLILKDLQGFSYEEMAEIMNVELGTVKSRLFRAREALRELLRPLQNELKK